MHRSFSYDFGDLDGQSSWLKQRSAIWETVCACCSGSGDDLPHSYRNPIAIQNKGNP